MRNWNEIRKEDKEDKNVTFLPYLWGIEIFFFRCAGWQVVVVFTLPMRNWNRVWQIKKPRQSQVFTLPMRNWNYSKKTGKGCFCISFYPTYEELKHSSGVYLLRSSGISFYPTYEELKRIYHCPDPYKNKFLPYLWGIERCSLTMNRGE